MTSAVFIELRLIQQWFDRPLLCTLIQCILNVLFIYCKIVQKIEYIEFLTYFATNSKSWHMRSLWGYPYYYIFSWENLTLLSPGGSYGH